MAVYHPGLQAQLGDLMKMVRDEARATLQNASIGRAGFRVYGGGWIRVENGGLDVTGTARVTGRLEGSGTLDWTGPWFLRGLGQITGALDLTGALRVLGPWDMQGNGKITGNLTGSGSMTWTGPWDMQGAGKIKGNVDITGALDVKNRITLGPSGYLEAGTVRIDRGGSYGGRIASTGSVLALSASGSVIIDGADLVAGTAYLGNTTVTGNLKASGTITGQSKQFRIEHPLREDHFLLHGCTESPVAGVEYWGEATLPESGELVVALPDYFEALTKQENRAVMVTARGFVADWGDIEDGLFAVSGNPGGRFSWLVKAERAGADFEPVESIYGPVRKLSG